MNDASAKIYCPDLTCQTPNPEVNRFCEKCRSPLLKRYLRAVGENLTAYKPGNFLVSLQKGQQDRYLVKRQRIVLDTRPGQSSEDVLEDIPPAVEPYLKLVAHRLHVPQVYDVVPVGKDGDIVLLEQAAIETASNGSVDLLPALTSQWSQANAIRQLNWLWQIAQLWLPLSRERVASSLTEPQILRVEGSLVRLLELIPDSRSRSTSTLAQLGQLWMQWVPTAAQPELRQFLSQLCQELISGQTKSSEQLLAQLDGALQTFGRQQTRQVTIATLTDQGPSRQRNEDSCYPPSGTQTDVSLVAQPAAQGQQTAPIALAIVCDGIGGHEGGNVASGLAIEATQQQVLHLQVTPQHWNPQHIITTLEAAACAANDLISQRNDRERRQDRQRMGTTLVMALAHAHELYLAHVGDSRAYRITRTGCYQVTLDDDVASREVRLGYALYRDALRQPIAGSLVQALGMSSSASLSPTVQRFVLDEDCIFLLCSDGLSEFDRVEQNWETEIAPILDGTIDLTTASQRLITIANTQNGHDNSTVALVHCRVTQTKAPLDPTESFIAELEQALDAPTPATAPAAPAENTPSTLKTQILPASSPPSNQSPKDSAPQRSASALQQLLFSLGAFSLLLLCAYVVYSFIPGVNRPELFPIGSNSSPSPTPIPASPLPSVVSSPSPPIGIPEIGTLMQVGSPSSPSNNPKTIALLNQPHTAPPSPPNTPNLAVLVPTGSILQVMRKQASNALSPTLGAEKQVWLQVKVCSVPQKTNASTLPPLTTAASTQPVSPGQAGWIQESAIGVFTLLSAPLSTAQQGSCTVAASTSPAPTSP